MNTKLIGTIGVSEKTDLIKQVNSGGRDYEVKSLSQLSTPSFEQNESEHLISD